MLARVLLGEPSVLLLDEPDEPPRRRGRGPGSATISRGFPGAILVISHDRAFLDRVATRVVELDGIHDELQEYEGGYTAYKSEKAARWQKLLLDYEAQEKHRSRLAADIEATKGHASAVEHSTRNDLGAPLREESGEESEGAGAAAGARTPVRALDRRTAVPGRYSRSRFRRWRRKAEFIVQAKDVTVTAGSRVLLDGADLSVRAGERVLVTGPNGAGKSSLLRELAGRMRTGGFGVLPQTHDHLRLDTNVIEYFRSRVPVYPEDAERILEGYLFGDDQWTAPLRTLSAGELRRLLLAVLINQGVSVLVLDEPTNYLDFDSLDVVERALRDFDGTILAASHDRYFAEAVGFDTRWRVADGVLTSLE